MELQDSMKVLKKAMRTKMKGLRKVNLKDFMMISINLMIRLLVY